MYDGLHRLGGQATPEGSIASPPPRKLLCPHSLEWSNTCAARAAYCARPQRPWWGWGRRRRCCRDTRVRDETPAQQSNQRDRPARRSSICPNHVLLRTPWRRRCVRRACVRRRLGRGRSRAGGRCWARGRGGRRWGRARGRGGGRWRAWRRRRPAAEAGAVPPDVLLEQHLDALGRQRIAVHCHGPKASLELLVGVAAWAGAEVRVDSLLNAHGFTEGCSTPFQHPARPAPAPGGPSLGLKPNLPSPDFTYMV